MADLIDRQKIIEQLELLAKYEDPYDRSVVLGVVHTIKCAPAVDAVSRGLYEQIKWERDIAMSQLEEHGIAFGAKAERAVDAVEDRFATVFGEIAAYNCHEEWLWELADKLSELEAGKYFYCPITTEEWLTDRHALWMMLVSAYGNWGTSIRHGWIEKTAEAASFINEATEHYAEWR